MFKFRLLWFVLFCLMNILAIPFAHAQVPLAPAQIFEPDHGPIQLAAGYQYQDYKVLGRKFHDNGYNTDFSMHVFDWLTGSSFRVAVAAEGTAAMGFAGLTNGTPRLDAKSLFLGGGPHVSVESNSRIEPWLHVLPGLEHFRFTQTATLGSNSAFGFMAGGGLDFRILPAIYWRVQADYIGAHFQSSEQSNFSVGSGLVLYF